jgi:hypothetical protein
MDVTTPLPPTPRATARPRTLILVVRVALVLCSLLMALGLAEAAVRRIPAPDRLQSDLGLPDDDLWADPDWRGPPRHAYRSDPVLGYTNAESTRADVRLAEHPGRSYRFRTDNYGLRRDTDVEIAKPAGTWRVLAVGDSQTSGYGSNDETYPGRLEQALEGRNPGRSIEVLNAGVDGYGPQHSYLWYRERGVPLTPDLLIFTVYIGNDLSDLAFGDVNGAVIDEDAGLVGPLRTPWAWATLHSELVKRVEPAMMAQLRDPLVKLGIQIGPPLPPAGFDALIRVMRECHGCWFQSLRQAVRARTNPADIEQSYRRMEEIFRLLSGRIAANGGRLMVLMIPTKPQVEPQDERGAVNRADRLLELTDADLAYDDVAYSRILDIAQRVGVTAIDTLEEMRAASAAGGKRLYYRRDWHLNPDGNRALAAILDRALAEQGITLP